MDGENFMEKSMDASLSQWMDPEKKPFERLIFPTKYSSSPKVQKVSHWLSKLNMG